MDTWVLSCVEGSLILGDREAVSRVGRKGGTEVFKYRRKSPWVPTLTKLFPKIQVDAGSWLGTKNALYYNFGQSVNSFFGARARQAMIETIAIVYEHTKRTQEMCLPIGHNNTEHFLCPIRSRHLLIEFLEMVPWESVPRGSSTCAWKLVLCLFSWPDWLPMGLWGWGSLGDRCVFQTGLKFMLPPKKFPPFELFKIKILLFF